MKDAEKSVEKSSSKIEKKFGVLGKSVQDVEKNVDDVNKTLKQVPSTDVEKTESAFEKLKRKIQETKENTEELNSTVESMDSKLEKLQGVAVKGFAAIGTGLTTVAGISINTASNIDSAMSKFAATTDLASGNLESYEEILKGIYYNNYGESFDDIATAMSSVSQQMGEMDDVEFQNVTEGLLVLRDTFDMDFNETLRGTNQLMKQFGLSSDEALDLMTRGAQMGLNYTDELGDNVSEYAGKFAQAGYSADEYFQLLKNGTRGGAYNLDKVNDAINEVTTRLADGTIADSLDRFSSGTHEVFRAWQNGEATQKDVIDSIVDDIANCENEQQKLNMAATAFGTMGEDANADFVVALRSTGDAFKDVGGTMDEVKDTAGESLEQMFGKLKRSAEQFISPLGDQFLPVIKEIVGNVTDFLDNADPNDLIAGIGGVAAALAGVATAAAAARGALALFNAINFVNSAGGLAAMFSGLAGSIGAVVTTIAPFVAGATAVIAVIALISAAVIQLWNDSEEFREGVTTIIEELQEIFQNLWETILQPIFENLMQVLNDIWVNGIQPLWETFKQFINDLTVKFSELLAAVSPIVNWFITYFGPMLVNVFNNVANVFGSVVNTILNVAGALLKNIGQVIGGVIDVFTGIIEFITGIFTGDWEKAWQGIVDIFGGIFETIGGLVAAPINGVIGLINGVIDAVNSLSIDIPDWIPVIGGQHFGVDIPTIPYLEKGGILKKGQVGLLEGSGAEAVVPLDKNKAWIRAVAKDMVQFTEPVQRNFNQTNNFYQAVETPAEYARAMRLQMRYGLAGAKK